MSSVQNLIRLKVIRQKPIPIGRIHSFHQSTPGGDISVHFGWVGSFLAEDFSISLQLGTALDVMIHETNLGKYNTNRFQLKGHAVLVIRGIALAMTIKRF